MGRLWSIAGRMAWGWGMVREDLPVLVDPRPVKRKRMKLSELRRKKRRDDAIS